MINVKHTPEVLESLRGLFVFHSQYEVKESFVVHFTLESLKFLKNSVDENLSKSRCIPSEFSLL